MTNTTISKLKAKEKALIKDRIRLEKQYFMRKIGEKTFSKRMIAKQDKILKIRAKIKEMSKKKK
jgi:hypothetical protein